MPNTKRVKKLADGSWGNGSVTQRGDKFRLRWREDGERRSVSGFASRFEALEELEKIQARLSLGQPGSAPAPVKPPSPTATSFDDLTRAWVAYREAHGRRTAKEEVARWELHLAQPLATQTLESVSSKWVRELAAALVSPTVGTKAPDGTRKQPVSGPTAHRVLTLLSSFYSWAVDEGLAKDNPARVALRHKDVKALLKSDHDPKSQPFLKSWDAVMKLYKALEAPTAIAYLISARAGLRPGEVIALLWGDVDLKARTIRVERQVRSGKEGPTKSGKPRTVPIVPVLAKELAAWGRKNAATEATDLVCPPSNRVKLDGSLGARWGKFLGPKTVAADMAAAFDKTKIRPSTLYNYGRHTFGSLSGLGGISTWRLQEILGHADIKTTLHYVSLRDQALTAQELTALGA
jgi:integrase